jgi:hypothetical protein
MPEGMEAEFCSCDFDYDGTADIHREELVKARKEHTCLECEEAISKGEKYVRVTQLFEGEWWTGKICRPCEAIRQDYCAPYSLLRERIGELLGFDYVTGEFCEESKYGGYFGLKTSRAMRKRRENRDA